MFVTGQQTPIHHVLRHLSLVVLMACITVVFWLYQRDIRPQWQGVPTVPSQTHILMRYLGEQQLGYRSLSLMIQNFGDTGGQTVPLREFDYQKLQAWLELATGLDPQSNYIPNLAAYYFGGIDDKARLRYMIDYLAKIGQKTDNGKWRWLAQAVFLARFKLDDQDLALKLAYQLAAMEDDALPIWTDQMPAFVLAKVGEEKAAMDVITTIMATDRTLQANEINYMCWYLADKLTIDPDILAKNDIYQDFCR